MHQPFYREGVNHHYALPWAYLHAIKDYTDMANILDQVDGARSVVNFVPSLTAQIQDYGQCIHNWLNGDGELPDQLLSALVHPSGRFKKKEKLFLVNSCFRLNHEHNLYRYPQYATLWRLYEQAHKRQAVDYLGASYFLDLITWYHLGWTGETLRSNNPLVKRLIAKGSGFSMRDRRDLLSLIGRLLNEIPARYRELASKRKIEISTTPYAHPILPLLLDFKSAHETIKDAPLPSRLYPGGAERAREHIDLAIKSHAEVFGQQAAGCWPSEGAISTRALALLGKAGFSWAASGEGVLHHSLGRNPRESGSIQDLYHPWRIGKGNAAIDCFFRDDRLSDLIGFEYQHWRTDDAIANFMHELAGIRHHTQGMNAPVVSIILDGENAWEYYPENGLPFLRGLYQSIAEHPEYDLTTFSEHLSLHPRRHHLPKICAGSWVYGNLATWIGDPAKNRAWEMLIEAKECLDHKFSQNSLNSAQAESALEQLRICEGSDWFWWFGDYNPAEAVRDFDRLYRFHLIRLYQLLEEKVPDYLQSPISAGGDETETSGAMRRGTAEK